MIAFPQSAWDISIHALREEGDGKNKGCTIHRDGFLSTPSARRATFRAICAHDAVQISIHALREEGDPVPERQQNAQSLFLSTPSARRAT